MRCSTHERGPPTSLVHPPLRLWSTHIHVQHAELLGAVRHARWDQAVAMVADRAANPSWVQGDPGANWSSALVRHHPGRDQTAQRTAPCRSNILGPACFNHSARGGHQYWSICPLLRADRPGVGGAALGQGFVLIYLDWLGPRLYRVVVSCSLWVKYGRPG